MELAEIVSDGIAGEDSRIISIRGRFYAVRPPSPFVLGRMLKWLSRLEASDGDGLRELTVKRVAQYGYMDAVIATAILGDCAMTPLNRIRLRLYRRRFGRASDAERLTAFRDILSIVIPDAFFVYARLAMELTGRMVNTKSSEGGR
jgi:hypothetical protein